MSLYRPQYEKINPFSIFLRVLIIGFFVISVNAQPSGGEVEDKWEKILKQKKYDDVIAGINKEIKKNPNDPVAYFYKGNYCDDFKIYDQAVENYTKAIKLGSASPSVYFNRGCANLSLGNFDQAISDFNKTLEIDKDAKDVYYPRGRAYYYNGDYAKAIADLRKAESFGYNVDTFLDKLKKDNKIVIRLK
ncbi:MAG: tetratricopeptide repeat protein [Candidatus Omnitrophica bacterium]|nr:tetratricopeptide repeat protein [Candidatus Omnitrophota bacterium]